MLQVTATGAGAVIMSSKRAAAGPKANVQELTVISQQPDLYHGWPTVARCKDGRLAVVCSGGREGHVCPFGRVELMMSRDGGRTWGWPRVLMDSDIDDRDAGALETAKGSLLATTFTSLAYEQYLAKAEKLKPGQKGAWSAGKLKRWRAAHNRLTADKRKGMLGSWIVRSTDGGMTWSGRYRCPVNSPHGPIQLTDGRLLYAGKELWHGEHRIGVCESAADGVTWRWLAQIPTRKGDVDSHYHELHAVEAKDGRIVAQIRNHNKANGGETLQSESSDGGKTWSEPRSIGVWGLPSHLLRLKDGRLLMTYGHRRKPFGNQARVSEDHGKTWSDPMIVSGDGIGGDLGYPSTAQLDDGALLSVWYERMKGSPRAVLRQARWALEA
jgi:sialidase-1